MTHTGLDSLFPGIEDPHLCEVGLGEYAIARHPQYLMTPALGSCVGVALYDSALKRGGLAHVMLPTPLEAVSPGKLVRFASVAIPEMVQLLADGGSPRRRLVAKLAGGASMFNTDTTLAHVGERNIIEVKHQLGLLGIPILAEDIGERHARTVELRLDTGALVVRSYLYGVKRL